MTRILSSSFSQILNTNPETGNVIVEVSGASTGGGDASAANQTVVQANAGNDASKAIAIQGITNGKTIPVSLGVALPAGSNTIGSISNTSFGISGTLPAFATPPTVNIGTAPSLVISSASDVSVTTSSLPMGASTSALQLSIQADAGSDANKAIAIQGVTGGKAVPVSLGAALPAGSNTIGSIGNTAFGISGTLPAFAATPTVNIGTAPNLTISSTERTPSLTPVTSSGTIALGARSVSIANIGSAAGTVLGTSVGAGVAVNFTAQSPDTLAAIAYNATGTTFLIAEVR